MTGPKLTSAIEPICAPRPLEIPRPEEAAAPAQSAMAATAFPAATEAARRVLRDGGNAVDAAVAAAWMLGVCEPSGSGLGGQATMLVCSPDGRCVVLDGHSHGPASLSRKLVSRAEQRAGFRAATVPSLPAVLGAAVTRFGRLPLSTTIAPAAEMADRGVTVTRLLRRHIQWCREALAATPATARIFLPEGRPPATGTVLRQPELSRTLRRIAAHGVDDFYRGGLSREIAADMERHGGLITAADLNGLRLPVFREAISTTYRGHEVISAPAPGGGLQVLLGLNLLEAIFPDSGPDSSPASYEMLARIIQAVFRERARWPIDPQRLTESLQRWLLSAERAQEIAAEVKGPLPPALGRSAEGPGDTTHLCVADRDGLVVSLTQSIQSLFGAKVMNEQLGFLYNNYLCTCPRYRHPAQLRANALPQSNAAPTIVFARGNRRVPRLVLGAAGSRRITSSILQVIVNHIDRGMSVRPAVDSPRIHATLAGHVAVERQLLGVRLEEVLRSRFRTVTVKAFRSYSMGAVQALAKGAGGWQGAADPRREGTADGC